MYMTIFWSWKHIGTQPKMGIWGPAISQKEHIRGSALITCVLLCRTHGLSQESLQNTVCNHVAVPKFLAVLFRRSRKNSNSFPMEVVLKHIGIDFCLRNLPVHHASNKSQNWNSAENSSYLCSSLLFCWQDAARMTWGHCMLVARCQNVKWDSAALFFNSSYCQNYVAE